MLSAVLVLVLGLVVVLVITAATGYFVAQEFAYMSVNRARLRALEAEGDTAAARALAVTSRTSFMLSGAQLGITVTGLLVGNVAEPLIGESLGTLLGGVGVPLAVGISVGTVLALLLSTVIQMVFGELFPKNLAIANPMPLALRLAASTRVYLRALGWLITVFDHAANALLRLVRIEPIHDVDSSADARELTRIVADSRASGDLSDDLSLLLDRILELPEQDVEHAMVPRSRTGVVRDDWTIGELRELMAREHTRYPVLDEQDDVVGVVEMIQVLHPGVDDDASVTTIMQEPLFLPTLMKLPDAIDALVGAGAQLACVLDEYGGFAGVLTLEDIAEELVGEITDEHDGTPPDGVRQESENVWTASGGLHVDEAERAVGRDLPEGDYETVSGLVIATHGSIPEVGERVRVDLDDDPSEVVEAERVRRHLDVDVLEVERHVPSLVRLTLHEVPVEDDDADEGDGAHHGTADQDDVQDADARPHATQEATS